MTCLKHTHTKIPPHLENRNRNQEPQNNEQASYQHEIIKVYFEQAILKRIGMNMIPDWNTNSWDEKQLQILETLYKNLVPRPGGDGAHL